MLKKRKIPMRMCVGCREMKPKAELLRIVRPQEGECAIDRKGKAPGRGAYLCENSECLKRAVKTKALERALEAKLGDDVLQQLSAQFDGGIQP
ncbi:MAG: YlxR family protein [Christensenellales bacterium]|jgi:predicted RNA-binding protein YlxR (DUF448 family)|nr:YlxR family protein [Christensenellales bacterium]